MIKDYDKNLLEIRPTPAEIIIKSSEEGYDIKDYVADIVQFLSCKDVINILQQENFANDRKRPTAYNIA